MSDRAIENRDGLPANIFDLGTSIESTAADLYEEVRRGAANVLEQVKEVYDHARKFAQREGRAVALPMHQNLYQAIGIGAGVGMLVSFLSTQRDHCNDTSY